MIPELHFYYATVSPKNNPGIRLNYIPIKISYYNMGYSYLLFDFCAN